MARFLGLWVTSLVALVLVSALVLGREAPPRTYDPTAVAAAFEDRYAAAAAALEAGGVLYLRTEHRTASDGGDVTSIRTTETWLALEGDLPVARSEETDDAGEVIRILEFAGSTRTRLVDRTTGTDTDEPALAQAVQTPAELLAQLRARTLDLALAGGELIGTTALAGLEAARIAGPEPAASETTLAIADPLIHLERQRSATSEGGRVISELALVDWAVLPPGTPLGTRPD